MKWALIQVAVLLVAVSGCSNGPNEDADGDTPGADAATAYDAALAAMAGVPCQATVGAGTSDNVKLLGNTTLEEGPATDIDVRGDLLATTRALYDISDPIRPVQLVNFDEADIPGGGDVKFLPDNQSIVLGGGPDVRLIDIRDPANPVLEDEWSFSEFGGVPTPGVSRNAHMLFAARIADIDWVFVAPNSNQGVFILRVDGEVGSRTLNYVTQTLPVEGGPLGPHDMFVHRDPLTNDWYLYSADGFHGWAVFNVNDPSAPLFIGGFLRPESGYTHTIQATKIGEKRIVATIQEVGVNALEIYDATILQAPVLIGVWQVGPGASAPQHNFNIVNGSLYLAHYGHGMFVFDLEALPLVPGAGTASLQPVAHYDPTPGGENYVVGFVVPGVPDGFEALYDVVLQDGILYAGGFGDPVTGVHVIGYGCVRPGDPAETSVG